MQITHLRVATAIARLDATRLYHRASSPDAAYLHQLGAAQRHGLYPPFAADAHELNCWLTSVQAGRDLCRDAWDLFMEARPGAAARRA